MCETTRKDGLEQRSFEEIKIPAAARFNFVQGSLNKIVEALSKSTTSVEAENGLIAIHSCFVALYTEKAKAKGSELKQPMRRMCARRFLVKRAQEELNEVIDAMKTKKLTFEQAVQKKPSKDRASHLVAIFKYSMFHFLMLMVC